MWSNFQVVFSKAKPDEEIATLIKVYALIILNMISQATKSVLSISSVRPSFRKVLYMKLAICLVHFLRLTLVQRSTPNNQKLRARAALLHWLFYTATKNERRATLKFFKIYYMGTKCQTCKTFSLQFAHVLFHAASKTILFGACKIINTLHACVIWHVL